MAQLEHVIVLVLENRSFDHLLGYLPHPSSDFDGLANRSDLGNYLDPRRPDNRRWYQPSPTVECRLPVDPDHEHQAVLAEIEHVGRVTNAGFVHAYMHKVLNTATHANRRRLLHTWSRRLALAISVPIVVLAALQRGWWTLGTSIAGLVFVALQVMTRPKRPTRHEMDAADTRAPLVMNALESRAVPVLSRLATEFATCQRWFCSVPGETWPNRNFFHAGSSSGSVNIELGVFSERTLFQVLDEAERSWRVYYGQFPPQVFCFPYVLERSVENSGRFEDLFRDLDEGELPTYAFVEPHHGLLGKRPSCSQHPGNNLTDKDDGSDFRAADRLIGEIYQRLARNEELFKRTMFVITYDEHGGLYDHRRPPLAAAVKSRSDSWTRRFYRWLSARHFPSGFDFRRLGPRVPCVVVSPWIPAHKLDGTVRDHTSIPRTVRKLFAPRARKLSRREARAATIDGLLTRSNPRTGPDLPDLGAEMSQLGWPPLFEDDQANAPPEPPRSRFEWRLVDLTSAIDRGTQDDRKGILRSARRRRPMAALPVKTPRRRAMGPLRSRQLRATPTEDLVGLFDATEFRLGALAAEQLGERS